MGLLSFMSIGLLKLCLFRDVQRATGTTTRTSLALLLYMCVFEAPLSSSPPFTSHFFFSNRTTYFPLRACLGFVLCLCMRMHACAARARTRTRTRTRTTGSFFSIPAAAGAAWIRLALQGLFMVWVFQSAHFPVQTILDKVFSTFKMKKYA